MVIAHHKPLTKARWCQLIVHPVHPSLSTSRWRFECLTSSPASYTGAGIQQQYIIRLGCDGAATMPFCCDWPDGGLRIYTFDVRPFVTFMFWCCIGIRADLWKVGMKPPASLFCVAYSVSFHGRIIAVEPGFKVCLEDELGLRSMDHFFERLARLRVNGRNGASSPIVLHCFYFIISLHGRIIAVEHGFKVCLEDELGLRSIGPFFWMIAWSNPSVCMVETSMQHHYLPEPLTFIYWVPCLCELPIFG